MKECHRSIKFRQLTSDNLLEIVAELLWTCIWPGYEAKVCISFSVQTTFSCFNRTKTHLIKIKTDIISITKVNKVIRIWKYLVNLCEIAQRSSSFHFILNLLSTIFILKSFLLSGFSSHLLIDICKSFNKLVSNFSIHTRRKHATHCETLSNNALASE